MLPFHANGGRRRFRFALLAIIVSLFSGASSGKTDTSQPLSVIQAGVERSEDAPFISSTFQFLPGEYVYFTFQVTGFATKKNETTDTKSLSLGYEITAIDSGNVPLAPAVTDLIGGDLGVEDKNWTPKRRASFLLPSYVAAGEYKVRIVVRDLVAKTKTAREYPFKIGGVRIEPAPSVQAIGFEFLRGEDDEKPLEIPAYSAGDTVWVRFEMAGFKRGEGNRYRLAYGVKVLKPNGKLFLDEPDAANVEDSSFYPAPYVPGELQVTTPKDSAHGTYQLILTVRDLISNQTSELSRSFTIE